MVTETQSTRPIELKARTYYLSAKPFCLEWDDGKSYGYYIREAQWDSHCVNTRKFGLNLKARYAVGYRDGRPDEYGTYTPEEGHVVTETRKESKEAAR